MGDSALVLNIVVSKGKALKIKRNMVFFFVALFCLANMRHNGILPAFGTLLVFFLFAYQSDKRRLLTISLCLLLCTVLFKGPIFSYLDVNTKDKNVLKAHLPIQQIGEILNGDVELSEKEAAFLSQILPLDYWKKAYNPRSCMSLIFGKRKDGVPCLNGDFLKEKQNYKKLLNVWLLLALQHPDSILQYYICELGVESQSIIFVLQAGEASPLPT